ncbi:ferritin-like domain-containing protein [Tabrizicola aquatica]|uniref:ferritin-like domain-containing protein n=1 Tax=Tabrizicola aquatica TaxID=909926 RepID=UPI000CD2D1EA|nr:PA2169 family four-helix-bundle protein [Tabrizicola aquatica]
MQLDPTPLQTMDDAALDSLALAHTRTVDALAGFEVMVDKAEPQFRATAARFRDLHRAHAAALSTLLQQHGRTPDDDGTFMASVNRLVVTARAFFDEIDEDVMDQVRNGEDHVLAAYRDAESGVPFPVVKSSIANLRTELEALLAETRDLD